MTETTKAVDFLAALTCEPEIFETNGVTVELRSLTFAEVQRLATKHKDDNAEMTFQALALGLVSPKLDETQLEQLRNVKPGAIMKMAQRVMEISGMTESAGPLAGTGSLPST